MTVVVVVIDGGRGGCVVVSLVFVVQMSFVLHTHNGISIYHTLDIVIYLTAIGFFANVNKS